LATIPRGEESLDTAKPKQPPPSSPDVMVVDTDDPEKPHILSVSGSRKMSYSGPMPDPGMLAAYDRICPGSARQIIRNTLSQSKHRRRLESQVIASDIRQAWYGMWAGAGLSLVALLGGITLVGRGHDWAGAGICGSGIAGLASVFVYGTRSRREERQEKAKLQELVKHGSNPVHPHADA
jgi:uncharacterized membrane protein